MVKKYIKQYIILFILLMISTSMQTTRRPPLTQKRARLSQRPSYQRKRTLQRKRRKPKKRKLSRRRKRPIKRAQRKRVKSTRKKSARKRNKQKWIKDSFSKCLSVIIPRTLQEIKDHPDLCMEQHKKEAVLFWRKKTPMPFSELILSWNASRPQKGTFSFYANIRHHSWSGWKKIAEWGKNGQKTFGNTKNRYVHAKHVRVEMQKRRVGFSYQIKVVARKGADLRRLKALFVNISNEQDFRTEKRFFSLPSVKIDNVPEQCQYNLAHTRNKDLCSPTSLSMITQHFINKYKLAQPKKALDDHSVQFADRVRDQSLNIYGNWLFNVAQAYNATRGNVLYRVERLNNFESLYSYLRREVPIAVSIRGKLKDVPWSYKNGHFIVVIGWNKEKQRIICLDPAFRSNMVREYRIKDFLKAWGKSRNLSYVPVARRASTAPLTSQQIIMDSCPNIPDNS